MQREMPPAEAPAAQYLEALHGLGAAAVVCEGAAGDVWGATDSDAAAEPFMLRAAEAVGASLAHEDLKLLPLNEGGTAAQHAVEALAILFRHTRCGSTT